METRLELALTRAGEEKRQLAGVRKISGGLSTYIYIEVCMTKIFDTQK